MTRITKSNSTADSAEPSRPTNPHPPVTADWYLFEIGLAKETLAAGTLSPVDAKRKIATYREIAETEGIDLAMAAREQMDPIRRLLGSPKLVEQNATELRQLREAMDKAEALDAQERTVKKKWIELIDETLALQERACQNPVFFTIYVIRDQEGDRVLDLENIHIGFFEAWNDREKLYSLQEAPPGVGKTTMLYGQNLWDFKEDQTLRCVKVCQDLPTAKKRLAVVRMYIDHPRFRAVAPDVRIDKTQPDNSVSFTLVRRNVGSQDPSMVAAGATGAVQGAGFDRIDCDDLCDQKVKWEKSTRDRINASFFNVLLERIRDLLRARVRYICTPWHNDDTAGRIITKVRSGELIGWRIDKHAVRETPSGVPIPNVTRPGRQAKLISVKASQPETYAYCYRLDPTPTSLRLLKHVVFYDEEGGTSPLCPESRRKFCAEFLAAVKAGEHWQVFDPAAGGADHTCSVGFSVSANGRAAITSADFWKVKATDAIPLVCDVVQKNVADKVLMEAAGGMKGVADIWGAMLEAKLGAHYRGRIYYTGTRLRDNAGKEVGRNVSKQGRFSNAAPYLSNGVIVFPGKWAKDASGKPQLVCTDDPGLRYLYDQLMTYPNSVRDDGIDTFAMFVNYNLHRLVRSVDSLAKPAGPAESTRAVSYLTALYREREEAAKKKAAGRKARNARSSEKEFFSTMVA